MSSCGDGRRDGECEEESGGPEGWQGAHFVEQEGSQRKHLRRILGGGVCGSFWERTLWFVE